LGKVAAEVKVNASVLAQKRTGLGMMHGFISQTRRPSTSEEGKLIGRIIVSPDFAGRIVHAMYVRVRQAID
jgi:hypothetical protein